MVLIAACVLAAHALVVYAFGVFLRPITMEFEWDRGALSVAPSIAWLISGFLAILSGRLSDKYGPRLLVTANGLLAGIAFLLMSQISSLWQVWLIWGLLMGIAGSCCFTPITSTIPRWFTKKRGIAMGLAVTGFGLGGMISPPLAQWLISTYEWPQAFIILGLITLIIVIPLAQFMKHSPQRIGLKPYGENETVKDAQSPVSTTSSVSVKQAIKTSHFWLFGLILACFFFILQVITIHIYSHAVDIGVSATVAASILSIVAGSSIIGRLSMGFVSDRIGARRALSACLVIVTLALIWLLFAKEIWMLYMFAVLFGIAYGGIIPLQTLLTGELFGLKFLGTIMASIMLLGMVGGILGGPVAGSIFDVTESYSLAFLICVVLCALAITLSLILLRSRGKEGIVGYD